MSDIKKIGIDVDGVLRDFSGDLYEVVKRERPQWLKPGVDVITEWDMEKCFNATRDELKEMDWYRHVDELFGNGKSFAVTAGVHESGFHTCFSNAIAQHFLPNVPGDSIRVPSFRGIS